MSFTSERIKICLKKLIMLTTKKVEISLKIVGGILENRFERCEKFKRDDYR